MGTHKIKPHGTIHQRINQITQTGTPIRPVVNWRGAPAYKLARLFTQTLKAMAPLPNTPNLQNTKNLIKKLEDIPVLPQFAFASLDITKLYTNIPVKET
jgi:hypothetical protein